MKNETPVFDVPQDLLTDPKFKMTGSMRRTYMRARQIVHPSTKEAKPAPVKLAFKLQGLPLVKLDRRRRQAARRASTAKHLLEKMSSQSRFRLPIAAAQEAQLSILKQVNAEIKFRNLRAGGAL